MTMKPFKAVLVFLLRLGVTLWYRLGIQRPLSWAYRVLAEPNRNCPLYKFGSLSEIFDYTRRFKWGADLHGVAIGSAGQFQWNAFHGRPVGDCDEFASYTLAAVEALTDLAIDQLYLGVNYWWDANGLAGHFVVVASYRDGRRTWFDYGPVEHGFSGDLSALGASVRAFYADRDYVGVATVLLGPDLRTHTVRWG